MVPRTETLSTREIGINDYRYSSVFICQPHTHDREPFLRKFRAHERVRAVRGLIPSPLNRPTYLIEYSQEDSDTSSFLFERMPGISTLKAKTASDLRDAERIYANCFLD